MTARIIRNANGQALAYLYFVDEPQRQMSTRSYEGAIIRGVENRLPGSDGALPSDDARKRQPEQRSRTRHRREKLTDSHREQHHTQFYCGGRKPSLANILPWYIIYCTLANQREVLSVAGGNGPSPDATPIATRRSLSVEATHLGPQARICLGAFL